MKIVTTVALLATAISVQAADQVDIVKNQVEVLDSALNMTRVFSDTTSLDATVIEVLGAGGINPIQVAISIDMGKNSAPKIFAIDQINMNTITSVGTLGVDQIMIHYTQAHLDDESLEIDQMIEKTLKVSVLRDANGKVADSILIEDKND